MPRAERFADATAIAALFFVILDPTAHGAKALFFILSALTAAVLAWFIVRHVLRDNLLAYPLATALAMLFASAAAMLQNHRSDLIVNGTIVIAAAVALAIWIAFPQRLEHA